MSRTLHYGQASFQVLETAYQSWSDVAELISAAADPAASGWVDVVTEHGVVTLFVTSGVPIWFNPEISHAPA